MPPESGVVCVEFGGTHAHSLTEGMKSLPRSGGWWAGVAHENVQTNPASASSLTGCTHPAGRARRKFVRRKKSRASDVRRSSLNDFLKAVAMRPSQLVAHLNPARTRTYHLVSRQVAAETEYSSHGSSTILVT